VGADGQSHVIAQFHLHYMTLRHDSGHGVVLFTVYTPADAAAAQRLRQQH
jgi:hypothetical protein